MKLTYPPRVNSNWNLKESDMEDLKMAVYECSHAAEKIAENLACLCAEKPELDAIVRSCLLLHAALAEISKGLDTPNKSVADKREQKPTVGRIVHYTNLDNNPEVRAAIITAVHSDTHVSLCVFHPNGQASLSNAMKTVANPGHEDARGKWNWPARI